MAITCLRKPLLLGLAVGVFVLLGAAGVWLVRSSGTRGVAWKRTATYAGDASCVSCHQPIAESYARTAHATTSSLASQETVHGNFRPSSNVLRTANPDLHFRMEAAAHGFTETAVLKTSATEVMTRTEPIEIVIGSGRKGQTYLYWSDGKIFQLPVSYWTEHHAWVNSPGYQDGTANFERPVPRRCFECHATSITWAGPPENAYVKTSLVPGLSCEKCHGPGSEHVARYRSSIPPRSGGDTAIVHPKRLSRERQIDACAVCHAGLGFPKTPPLSFRPGDVLADHVTFSRQPDAAHIDVHASQVQLMERSRCFQASPAMTCTTCHDVHQPQRDLAAMAAKCVQCHQVEHCGEFERRGRAIATGCVNCHMPLEQTDQIVIENVAGPTMQPKVRNHRIATYPEARGQ